MRGDRVGCTRRCCAGRSRNRKTTIAIGIVFLAVSLLLGSRLGSEFLPTLEEGNLWIRATMPPTISLEAGMPIVNRLREILLRHPEVVTVASQHGRPDNGSDAAGFFNAEFFVPLKPFDEWPAGMTKEKLIEQLQDEFNKEFVGIDFNFSQYIQDNVEEGLSGVKGANSIKIIGPDLTTLEQIARSRLARNGQGAGDYRPRRVLGARSAQFEHRRSTAPRRPAMDSASTTSTVWCKPRSAGPLQRLFWSPTANSAFRCGLRLNTATIWMRCVTSRSGCRIPAVATRTFRLSEVASITLDTGASYIFRETNQRYVPIKFSVRGRDLAGAVAEAQQRISQNVKLPNGYRIDFAGEFEWLQQAKKRLAIIMPVTFLLIMMLLYGLFNSWRDSMLALLGLPFAISGGLVGLLRFRIGFQHFGGDRIHFAVRRLGHERHFDPQRLLSRGGEPAWRRSRRCSMPSRSRCGRF